MKKERGITLVALIITIIILVILSAVTIQNTIGEHGLIDMATESAIRSRIAEYKDGLDQIGIVIMTENIHKNLTGREYLEKFKEKVEASELFKDKRSAEIIGEEEGETEEKLRVVTKEGFVFDVTEKETKYVGIVGEEGFTPLPDLKDPKIEINLSETKWVNHPITAKITVSDEFKSFIIQYTTRKESEPSTEALSGWTRYELGSDIEIPTNETIFVRVIDNVGNATSTASELISIIDTIVPEDPSGTVKGKNTNSITVTATAKDAVGTDTTHYKEESGIAQIIIELKGEIQGKEQTVTEIKEVSVKDITEATVEHTFTGLTQGTNYIITVKAVDKAGNVSSIKEITGGKTETVPGGETLKGSAITFTPDKNTWTQGPVNVTITSTYTAKENGGYKLQYTTREATANDWKDYGDGPVEMKTNGTIYARLKDSTGQTGTQSTATGNVQNIDTVKPDTPTITAVQGTENGEPAKRISVTVKAKDGTPNETTQKGEQSGICKVLISIDGQHWSEATVDSSDNDNSKEVTITHEISVETDGEYTVHVKAVDKADNESAETTQTVNVETTPPMITFNLEFINKYGSNRARQIGSGSCSVPAGSTWEDIDGQDFVADFEYSSQAFTIEITCGRVYISCLSSADYDFTYIAKDREIETLCSASESIINGAIYYIGADSIAECVSPESHLLVATSGEIVQAKDIKEGQNIAYYNFETKKTEIGIVETVYIHKNATDFVKYTFDDGSYIEATDYHPIYTTEGWKSLVRRNGYDIPKIGDNVKTENGWKKLTKIETFKGLEDYYDFKVKGTDGVIVDNYFANGTLVQGSY